VEHHPIAMLSPLTGKEMAVADAEGGDELGAAVGVEVT
jgi:hypothetical protein